MKTLFRLLPVLLIVLITASCGSKKEKVGKGSFFPVLSFIQSQVAHIDTSFYSITQLNILDSTRTDTIYASREQFRGLAKDFLGIPDISEKQYETRYKEEKIYDNTLNRAVLIYQPLDKETEIIQREEVVVTPDQNSGVGIVSNIIIDYVLSSKDSAVQKRMLWQADRSFQVTTIKQLPGRPETITTTKVTWNEPEN